jgi:hypothetical protein
MYVQSRHSQHTELEGFGRRRHHDPVKVRTEAGRSPNGVAAENYVRAGYGLFGFEPLAVSRLGVSHGSLAVVTGR